MNRYKADFARYLALINKAIADYVQQTSEEEEHLHAAWSYSLTAGGKRLRPVLTLATCEALGGRAEDAVIPALALEMIHTYSLIHDDLPALDNDDYRRGKLTCHKVFGAGMAVLAGDYLLNHAFQLLFEKNEVLCGKILSRCAGGLGMLGGQAADLTANSAKNSAESLAFLQDMKTGKLLAAALLMGEAKARGTASENVEELGLLLGRYYQVQDDLLDVRGDFASLGKTVGKDQKEDKFTAVSLYGVAGAEALAAEYMQQINTKLAECGLNNDFFRGFLQEIAGRNQ